jgi:hypothetical protein
MLRCSSAACSIQPQERPSQHTAASAAHVRVPRSMWHEPKFLDQQDKQLKDECAAACAKRDQPCFTGDGKPVRSPSQMAFPKPWRSRPLVEDLLRRRDVTKA